ncbi:MAG: hypothetical protein A9Z00_10430 [Thermobacillus sp. ZCTH02-B1]|uniref:hypothetical protein n=1 Tax=Thermobacillus sp. ZCTH02-B1 TaxID=1858795 RepID=UPI000B574610|nr:hypothetical protein [Thermobacillus sp. ZCTH02-B1]OUM94594.1 MAG: hypothetical protein A9Z00_10430 [Thermobacillus sp. ZCTH02-B1]
MKRRFAGRTLWDSRDGSVNVFLIGITAALFLFVAVLIDFARIAAFERLAETAVYSGVRSALSAYDGTLYERYGLFARGGSDGGEIFRRVISSALEPDHPDRGLKLLRTDVTHAEVSPGDTLGLHAVLERQILEEMKYKAPIDFTLEIVERFRGVAPALRETAHAANAMLQLQELFDSRQRHLEEAVRRQREAAEAVAASGLAARIPYPPGAGSGGTAEDAAAGYEPYVGWVRAEAERRAKEAEWRRRVEEERRRWEAACGAKPGRSGNDAERAADPACESPPDIPPPDLGPSYAAEIAAYEQSARETAAALADASSMAATVHADAIAAARQAVQAAAADNERMADVLREARQAGAGDGGGASSGGAGEPDASVVIRSLLEDASRLVLDAEWFDDYLRELSGQDAGAAALRERADRFGSAVAQALASPDQRHAAPLGAAFDRLRDAYRAYAAAYIGEDGSGSGGVIAARGRAVAELAAADEQRREYERRSEAKRVEAAELLKRLSRLSSDGEAEREFGQLRKRYEASLALNGAAPSGGGTVGGPDDKSGKYAKEASHKAAGLFGMLDGLAASFRDEVYLNEYAVQRFDHWDPRHLYDLVLRTTQSSDTTADGSDGGDGHLPLTVSHQEVEYILYGFHNPAGNIAAAHAEIFAVRVAIRLAEGFVECRALGHPLVVFAAAVAYSFEHALNDMVELVRTGKTELSKWLPIAIAYRDYLRLFLLLHGSKAEKLARITALIEHDTGYRLAAMPVALTGRADVSVNLWFLPGVMKGIAGGGMLEGRVVDGRYETTVVVGSSY